MSKAESQRSKIKKELSNICTYQSPKHLDNFTTPTAERSRPTVHANKSPEIEEIIQQLQNKTLDYLKYSLDKRKWQQERSAKTMKFQTQESDETMAKGVEEDAKGEGSDLSDDNDNTFEQTFEQPGHEAQ